MRWIKHGRIFNPADHDFFNGRGCFAQSPQTLICNDFVRIYFSTRVNDVNGKFLSHIAYVDMHNNLQEVIKISNKQVLPLGALGSFDEHGIFPINPVQDGERVIAYTTGWSRRSSVSVETGIGVVVSNDGGETFKRLGNGPVLSASLNEPYLVCDGFVKIYNGTYHMWYIFGTGWRNFESNSFPDRTYKIGHATSSDGIEWFKEEGRRIIPDKLGPDECQALPSVAFFDGLYHMFFCYRESYDFRSGSGRGYRIGHAISKDLENWSRDDEKPLLEIENGSWDSDMQCYPHVFELNQKIFMLYNGNEFGRFGFGLAELSG